MAFPSYTGQVVVHGHENLLSFQADESIARGQVVKTDSDTNGRTVEPADTSGEVAIGVAAEDASSGEQVRVACEGATVRGVADDTVTPPSLLAVDAGTNEGEVTAAASGDFVIGQALRDSTGTNTEAGIIFRVTYGLKGQ